MAPTDPHCTIGNNIDTNAMHVTSLEKCSRRYGAKNKTRIIVGTVFEEEIGPKETELGRCRTFIVAKFYLGGGAMKVATINIRSFNIHTLETTSTSTGADGGKRAAASTTTTTVDTTVTDPVSVQVFESPAPDPLNDEAFRVVVAQPMSEMPGHPLSPLTEDGGSVVWDVSAHAMDESTVEMPPPPPIPRLLPLPQNLPFHLPTPPLPPILAPRTPFPQRRSPG